MPLPSLRPLSACFLALLLLFFTLPVLAMERNYTPPPGESFRIPRARTDTATPLVVTGIQTISKSGACNKVTVRIEGSITGVTNDAGGSDTVLFELWDDGQLKASQTISIPVGVTQYKDITLTFNGRYLTGAPGIGVYARELNLMKDPFLPVDVQGSCNKPIVSQVSIGATSSQIGGSFIIADADGDQVKNMRIAFTNAQGNSCRTGYIKAGFDIPVAAGLINFVTRDCFNVLQTEGDVTWEIEAYDALGSRADTVSGTLVRSSSNLVPAGANLRWLSVPEEVAIDTPYTLQLSLVDASNNVITGFSAPGAMWATGIDIETTEGVDAGGKRLVWFENGVATISGFKAISEGVGNLQAQVPVRYSSGIAAKSALTSIQNAITNLSSPPQKIQTKTGICSKLGSLNVNLVESTNGDVVSNGTFEIQDAAFFGSKEWVPFTHSLSTHAWNVQNIIKPGQSYQLKYTSPTRVVDLGIQAFSSDIAKNCPAVYNISKKLLPLGGRPVLLVHGIMGSSLNLPKGKKSSYPIMPGKICEDKAGDCGKLDFYNPALAAVSGSLGWDQLETDLTARGFAVYRVAWDWRQSLAKSVDIFLKPVIEQAIKDTHYPKVDVVAHSMGGLLTRWLLQNETTNTIDRFVMVGTPNGGSVNAFYLLSQADPIVLDETVGGWTKADAAYPQVYTNAANNMFIRDSAGGGKPLVKGGIENDGAIGLAKYDKSWRVTATRRTKINQLVPGARVLLPLKGNDFIINSENHYVPHEQEKDYWTPSEDYELAKLFNYRSKNLLCDISTVPKPVAPGLNAWTWLLLGNTTDTIVGARVTDCGKSPCTKKLDTYTARIDDSFGSDPEFSVYTEKGDGTVPTKWATSGLIGIVACSSSNGTGSHPTLPSDEAIKSSLFTILSTNRPDIKASLPKSKVIAKSVGSNEIGLSIGIWKPLPIILSNGIGSNGINEKNELVETLQNCIFANGDTDTNIGCDNVIPGRYTLSIQPTTGYNGRQIPVEINSTNRIFANIIKSEDIDTITFDITIAGNLTIVDQPKIPKNVNVTFNTDQTRSTLTWDTATDSSTTGYRVYYREEGQVNFKLLTQLTADKNSYVDDKPAITSGSSALPREYVVVAINANGKESFASSSASTRTVETPDRVAFVPAAAQPVAQWVVSTPAVITGINVPVAISITEGEYSINGLPFTTETGLVSSGQTVVMRVHSLETPSILTVGTETFRFGTIATVAPVKSTTYSATTATGTGIATASISGGGESCGFTHSDFVAESNALAGVSFPHGLFDFSLGDCTAGSTVSVSITYPNTLPTGTQYWKYGIVAGNVAPHWYTIPANISGNTVTFSITDGGVGDNDLTANGSIVDPGGAGVTAAEATAIPTLSEWNLLLLVGLMGLAGIAAGSKLRRLW